MIETAATLTGLTYWILDKVGTATISEAIKKLFAEEKVSEKDIEKIIQQKIEEKKANETSDIQNILNRIDVIEILLGGIFEAIKENKGIGLVDNKLVLEETDSTNEENLINATIQNWESKEEEHLSKFKNTITEIGYREFGYDDYEKVGIGKKLAEKFAKQNELLNTIIFRLSKYPDFINDDIKESIKIATKALNPNKEYKIAFLGYGRVGKSTLINNVVDRDVLATSRGVSVTATTVKIFLNGGNKAEIHLYDNQEIVSIINNFINGESVLKQKFETQEIKINDHLIEDIKNSALNNDVKDYLEELIKTQIKRKQSNDDLEFLKISNYFGAEINTINENGIIKINSLNKGAKDFLLDLQNANSEKLNNLKASLEKKIKRCHIVKEIKFYISPSSSAGGFSLPPNICILDAPGYKPGLIHHNQILENNAASADCVVMITSPEYLASGKVDDIVNKKGRKEIKKYYVINKWDEYEMPKMDTVPPNYKVGIEKIGIPENLWLKTNAYAARLALLKFRGELDKEEEIITLENEINKYKNHGVTDPKGLWEISNIPLLIHKLNDFVENKLRVEELDTAERHINKISEIFSQNLNHFKQDKQQKVQYIRNRIKGNESIREHLERVIGTSYKHFIDNHKPEMIQRINTCVINNRDEVLDVNEIEGFLEEIFRIYPDVSKRVIDWGKGITNLIEGRVLNDSPFNRKIRVLQFMIWSKVAEKLETKIPDLITEDIEREINRLQLKNKIIKHTEPFESIKFSKENAKENYSFIFDEFYNNFKILKDDLISFVRFLPFLRAYETRYMLESDRGNSSNDRTKRLHVMDIFENVTKENIHQNNEELVNSIKVLHKRIYDFMSNSLVNYYHYMVEKLFSSLEIGVRKYLEDIEYYIQEIDEKSLDVLYFKLKYPNQDISEMNKLINDYQKILKAKKKLS